jgi:cell wall-associated NlpC family hydrolase
MPMLTGQRRRLHSGRWALRTGILATVTALAVAALAGPAQAGKISATRAQIASIEQQLNAFDVKLEASVNAYDAARQHLSQVRAQIRVNTIRLRVARHNLKVARAELSSFLVGAYKGDATNDPAAYVLGSGSFSDLVNRVEYVQRVAKSEGDLLNEISTAEHQIAARQAALKTEAADAAKLVAQKRAQKAAIETGLRQRQQLLDSVKGSLRREIARRNAARDAAAKRRAAALAQQQQQQQSTPPPTGSGGDTGGGGGGSYNPPPAGTLGQQAAALAQQYLGVPYVWGGASPSGFDCSGLVVYVYGQLGVSLPHYTFSLWNSGAHVSRDQLAPGDLVFFYSLEHVGIYIGGGLFVHAPHTGDVVKISSLSDPWYSSAYYGAVRISG